MSRLSYAEGVRAACLLFEQNTRDADIREFAERAGLMPRAAELDAALAGMKKRPGLAAKEAADTAASDALLRRVRLEWFGFVHAAVVYALMDAAPNDVVFAYLRSTRTLVSTRGELDEAGVDAFVDQTFAGYLERMARKTQRECPLLFYERLLELAPGEAASLPAPRLAFVSGMMAITMCCILDKIEQDDFEASAE